MQNTTSENKVKTKPIKAYTCITKVKECQSFVNSAQGKKPLFLFITGGTETALIPGISGAGQNIEQLKHIPALDADFLVSNIDELKNNSFLSKDKIPSPVILSKAMIDLLGIDISVIDTGTFIKPKKIHVDLNMGPAQSISTGSALGPIKTSFLFQKGEKLGSNLSQYPYVVIGECIPGSTTCALSVLCALGINAFDLICDSFPESNLLWKNQTVKDALLDNAKLFSVIKSNPLKAVEFFGDPTQAFISGFIKGAQKAKLPVLLAGGSQMLASYYIAKLLMGYDPCDTIIGTTSWVVNDKSARTKRLAELVGVPLMCSSVSFKSSQHEGLRAYEEGHIKEGVGAGGLMVLANIYQGLAQEEIISKIEEVYSRVYTSQPS